MNEPINKTKLLDIVIAIQIRIEKAQAIIKVMNSFSDLSNDDITLLDIINDYTNQVLKQTGGLSDGIRELNSSLEKEMIGGNTGNQIV